MLFERWNGEFLPFLQKSKNFNRNDFVGNVIITAGANVIREVVLLLFCLVKCSSSNVVVFSLFLENKSRKILIYVPFK